MLFKQNETNQLFREIKKLKTLLFHTVLQQSEVRTESVVGQCSFFLTQSTYCINIKVLIRHDFQTSEFNCGIPL